MGAGGADPSGDQRGAGASIVQHAGAKFDSGAGTISHAFEIGATVPLGVFFIDLCGDCDGEDARWSHSDRVAAEWAGGDFSAAGERERCRGDRGGGLLFGYRSGVSVCSDPAAGWNMAGGMVGLWFAGGGER